MILGQATPPASSRLWDVIKLVSQVASYAGTAAATALSIYAMLHKSTIEPEGPEAARQLTRAGRNYLIAFLIVSAVAVGSTILKDIADDQLKNQAAVREADAKKAAEKELLDALGKNFADFAKDQLTPAFKGINKDIGDSTTNLQKGISKSIDTFNSSIAGTSSQIKRAMLETSEETASAGLQIGSYELEIELPPSRRHHHNRSPGGFFDEDELLVLKGCGAFRAPPIYDGPTCERLSHAYQTHRYMGAFIDELLPSHNDGLEIIVGFPFLLARIQFPPKCRLLYGIAEGSREAQRPCVDASDYATLVTDPAIVEIEESIPVSILDKAGPMLRYKESGVAGHGRERRPVSFTNKYGRDVEVSSIELDLDVDSTSIAAHLPETLEVRETLNPVDGTSGIKRHYLLSMKSRRKELSVYPHKVTIAALYTRY